MSRDKIFSKEHIGDQVAYFERKYKRESGSAVELVAPVKELESTFPVVLYFGNENDREEFIAVVAEAMPNAVAKKI